MRSLLLSRPDLDFLLHDWLRVTDLTARERFAEHSRETVAALLADLPTLPAPTRSAPLVEALRARGQRPVDWSAWLRLDAEEVRRGELRGADRVKVAALADMLVAALGARTRS